ncbi:hypothetical protein GPECTOR_32g464 [Gonium pectorale]|uniref:Uncharacterized protein n=1 Tax=Gonium pectorale TaxID=33097 RepID=A0A150GDD9_GONPE|nr:hypothetical protein GPECTOR_32g464 [Gonium pectorale]|eukprot:KXZ47852.1 hypothetical protein GPECTOR_32g464 [Gonium pectorale]
MDAITRISYYFPTHTITTFMILGNLVINDSSFCQTQERSLVIAMLVLFGLACFFSSFTDTYTALNGQKFWVLMMPFYGPLCFSLPTDEDKDRVYDFFYLKVRDYIHAILSTAAFVLIMLFTNPICMCIFPSGLKDGTSSFDAAIVRTVPVVVALLLGMVMMCLGPPRQMLGFQSVPDTCPLSERPMASNPMYAGSQADYPPTIPEGDEDFENGPGAGPGHGGPPSIGKSHSQDGPMAMPVASVKSSGGIMRSGGGAGPGRESFHSEYRQSMAAGRQSQRQMGLPKHGEYGASEGGYSSGGGGFRQEN